MNQIRGRERREGLRLRFLPASCRAEAGRLWQRVEREQGFPGLACSWDWTETWLSEYGEVVPHQFVVGLRGDEPRTVVLLTRSVARQLGIPVRTVYVGTAGEPQRDTVWVEYNRVLAAPEDAGEFVELLLAALRRDALWHQVALNGFVLADAQHFERTEPQFRLRVEESPFVDLKNWASKEGDASAPFRSSVRRKIRQSLRVLGPVTTDWAETIGEGLEILDDLARLHQARWTSAGEAGVFSSQRFLRFHRELVRRLLPRGQIVLFRARREDETVGCLYSMVEHKRVLFYQSGLAQMEDNRVRPGYVLHALCMQECARRGFSHYDFLAGDSGYKEEMATNRAPLTWGSLRRPSARWALIDAVRLGVDRFNRDFPDAVTAARRYARRA